MKIDITRSEKALEEVPKIVKMETLKQFFILKIIYSASVDKGTYNNKIT